MAFLVYLQKLTLFLIWFFCAVTFATISYRGFQESVMWGIACLVIGLIVASVLFKIGKVIHKLMFGIIYAIVIPKDLKDAMKNTRKIKDEKSFFGGGDGLTPETAVTCDCSSLSMAISLANSYIEEKCGGSSELAMQYTMADPRKLRVYCVTKADGTEVKFYFDFSSQRQRAYEIQSQGSSNW